MFFVSTDFQEGGGTFSAQLRADGSRVLVKVYATSGCVTGTPYRIDYAYTTSGNGWLQPHALTASAIGLVGIASGAIASGCTGWVTVRGPVDNAQAPAASFTGSVGHAVYWGGATGIGATSGAFTGGNSFCGVLLEYANGSTTSNIFLTGNLFARAF